MSKAKWDALTPAKIARMSGAACLSLLCWNDPRDSDWCAYTLVSPGLWARVEEGEQVAHLSTADLRTALTQETIGGGASMTEEQYDAARERVMDSEKQDFFAARDAAYAWHGGQWSALYSFASTGGQVHSAQHLRDLRYEINQALNTASETPGAWPDLPEDERDDERVWSDAEALRNLLDVVEALPSRSQIKKGRGR